MAFRSLVKRWLLKRGIALCRPPGQFELFQYKLAAAKCRGLDIRSAIDGGAAIGGWSAELRKVWPAARILCIEPRDNAQDGLRRLQAELGNIEIAQTLIGAREETIDFYMNNEVSSVNAEFVSGASEVKRLPVTTLDHLVEKLSFPMPDLIKLDLQGAELSALEGAAECLKHATAILLEVNFFDFAPGVALFSDVLEFLKTRDFVLYDILALSHRPADGALAQGDVLFVRTNCPLRAHRGYWADIARNPHG